MSSNEVKDKVYFRSQPFVKCIKYHSVMSGVFLRWGELNIFFFGGYVPLRLSKVGSTEQMFPLKN